MHQLVLTKIDFYWNVINKIVHFSPYDARQKLVQFTLSSKL